MQSVETFHTDRLIAERLRAEHFVELRRMHRDRRVMATLAPAGAPNGGVLSDEETRQFLRRHLDHWNRHGYGLWVFRNRADGHFVGRAGLHSTDAGGKEEVVCFTLTTNRASQRVMEKAGFEYARDIVHAGLPHVFYRLTAPRWKERDGEAEGPAVLGRLALFAAVVAGLEAVTRFEPLGALPVLPGLSSLSDHAPRWPPLPYG